MSGVVVQLIPLALGIIMSPLAIIGVVAVLLSTRARPNSLAFLAGWILGACASIGVTYLILSGLTVHEHRDPPFWVPVLHLFLALVFAVGAGVMFAASQRIKAIKIERAAGVEPDPELPKMFQAISEFGPGKNFALGIGLFVLNPVDLSCAIAAALTLRLSGLSGNVQWVTAIAFVIVSVSSVAVPVLFLMIRGERAQKPLTELRTWIATHTKLLNVALLVLLSMMQFGKAWNTL
jgi:hypothetical protein